MRDMKKWVSFELSENYEEGEWEVNWKFKKKKNKCKAF